MRSFQLKSSIRSSRHGFSAPPLPMPATLRHRRNKIYQLGKFIVMNLRIMDIVLREKLAK